MHCATRSSITPRENTSAIWISNVAPVTPFPLPPKPWAGGLGKLHQDLFLKLKMSEFFEAIWHGEGVGDGGDLEEALQAYVAVKPEEGDWVEACAAEGADPVIERFASFEAYLDNADPLERIAVTPQMISEALALLPS
jgi:hypothetical protein